MPRPNYRARIDWHLQSATSAAQASYKAMLAEHSAAGRLQSGATLRRTVAIWSQCSDTSLATALTELGSVIERRGRRWSQAMADALAAVDEHRATAEAGMADTLKVANPPGGETGSAMTAVRGLLDQAAEDMRQRVVAFRDGWTAPRPRTWNERHPIAFAMMMAVVGAVFALVGQAVISRLITPPPTAERSAGKQPSR